MFKPCFEWGITLSLANDASLQAKRGESIYQKMADWPAIYSGETLINSRLKATQYLQHD